MPFWCASTVLQSCNDIDFQASANQKNLDVGANIFIGNLDPEVDEKLLYDTFSAFGVILQTPKVVKHNMPLNFLFVASEILSKI